MSTIIYNVAKHYNEAYVLVEINDIGQQVADILHQDLEYENMLATSVKGGQDNKSCDSQVHHLWVYELQNK